MTIPDWTSFMDTDFILPCRRTVPGVWRQSDLFHSHTAELHQAANEIAYRYCTTHPKGPSLWFELSGKMSGFVEHTTIAFNLTDSVSRDGQHFGCLQRAKLFPLNAISSCRLPLFFTRLNLVRYMCEVCQLCVVCRLCVTLLTNNILRQPQRQRQPYQ